MATKIPSDIIDKIRDEVAIEEVIGHFVPLKPKGSSFWGVCPFHSEKTPSFHVHPERQIFYCFGCNKGGNVFRFLMDREGMSFPEAVQWCASRIGLDLARFLEADGDGESVRSRILEANRRVAEWFVETLLAPGGQKAREYARERGLRPETLEQFQVGLAPSDGSALVEFARREGISQEILLQAQLLRRQEGRPPFAYFRSRLIFPIQGVAQKIHGFGGRILGAGEPKYLNSPETAVFHKRSTLYAVGAARKQIIKKRSAILVEGYLDALALHQSGWSHAVATCGTAFTPQQAQSLARYADRVTILFDGDNAGTRAAYKAAEVALVRGLDVRIAQLPVGLDPADMLQKGEAAGLIEVLETAAGLVASMAAEVERRGNSREMKERALHHLADLLQRVADPIRSELLMQEAADCFHVPRELLRGSGKGQQKQPQSASSAPVGKLEPGRRESLERTLLQLASMSLEARQKLFSLRSVEYFEFPVHRVVYQLLHDQDDEVGRFEPAAIAAEEEELASFLAAISIDSPEDGFDSVAQIETTCKALDDMLEREAARTRRRELEEIFRSGGDWEKHESLRTRTAEANRPTSPDDPDSNSPQRENDLP